jgi:plastocyanin
MLRKALLAAAFALLLASALAGCGDTSSATPVPTSPPSSSPAPTGTSSGASNTGDVTEIRIVAKDNLFDPASYTATAGKTLRIVAVNEGQNVHEVEVKGLMSETQLTPGQSKTVEVPNVAAGTYRIYCEIHEDSGMEGQLVVK